MIIGITGPLGSGKGVCAEYLMKRGFKCYSLSDVIRDEIRSRGEAVTRDSTIKVGNELREKYGAGVLAERILKKTNEDLKSGIRNIVVDSIRNPLEVENLRKLENFFLVAVDAPQKIRFRRIVQRQREGDIFRWKDFVERDMFEMKNPGQSNQQIAATMRMADAVVINDSTLRNFYAKIEKVLKKFSMPNAKRPDVDDYFLKIASVVAERSTCLRHHVGAVAVKNKQIISTGYNGAPSGLKDCLELGCLRNRLGIKSGTEQQICRAVHAEQNVIIQAAIHGKDISNATIYCTHTPCIICAKMLVNAKIKKFVTYNTYAEEAFRKLFEEAGVEVVMRKKPEDKIYFLE